MKYLMFIGLALSTLTLVVINTAPAQARRYCPLGGYCPPGTCTKFSPHKRVQYACIVANCNAANCNR